MAKSNLPARLDSWEVLEVPVGSNPEVNWSSTMPVIVIEPEVEVDVVKLTTDQKIDLIQKIWETIPEFDESPLSAEQQAILAERIEEDRKHTGSGKEWSEIRARLLARYASNHPVT
jgi:putative addiction module component (TIGR02574 family)